MLSAMELSSGQRRWPCSTTRRSSSGWRDAEDTEGLINLPLGRARVQAVAFFKRQIDDSFRVSLRSKGNVVRTCRPPWGDGGHKNAAGCTSPAARGQTRHRRRLERASSCRS